MGVEGKTSTDMDRSHKSTTALLKWLGNHGVGKRKARQFLIRSGCDSLESMAIFLRFQLPPLAFANEDCVNMDMYSMFGVNPRNARRIIVDLDVEHAINLDITEEATAHLVATDQLPPPSSPMSGVVPQSPVHSFSAAASMRPVAEGLMGPLDAQAADMRVPSPLDHVNQDVMLQLPPGELKDEATAAEAAPVQNEGSFGSAARASTSKAQAIGESTEGWDGTKDDLIIAYPRPANPQPTVLIPNPSAPAQQTSTPDLSPVKHTTVPSLTDLVAQSLPTSASNIPAQPNLVANTSVRHAGSHRLTPPASPYAHISDARSAGVHGGPMSSGNLSGPLSGRGMFPAYDPNPMLSQDNPSKSMEMVPGPLLSGGTSQHLPGVPTVSHPLDPGPYHKANAMLREQLPHYNVDVTVQFRWDNVAIFTTAVLVWLFYLAVRLYYIASGRTKEIGGDETSVPYSYVVLVSEFALGILTFYGQQNFWKQDVKYSAMDSETLKHISHETTKNGVRETVHVLITTYTEPASTVKECVIRCLVAPEPIYMEKHIYVCDDGHAKSEGPKKRAMVEELRVLGHTNVFYVGDRVKQPGQLNGKSANLNHVVLQKIFPDVRKFEEISPKDIIMVMDCDHMIKPETFNKMGPCMLDEQVAVTLVPQWFHNLILPDCFDSANSDFMLSKMPYSFGAGICYITGTNVMIRARTAFEVCKFAQANESGLKNGIDTRQIYAEDEISEDIELGTRVHASGYKSVFICEKLATGEVPLDARSFWRQRLRWLKGGHLFIMSPGSVFFKRQPHMSFYQKSLYWLCPVSHFIQIWAEPIMFTSPFFCLVLNICPYGMDELLFGTHIAYVFACSALSLFHREIERVIISMMAKQGFRVLWFTSCKAVFNTLMVFSGWKNPGHFKFTPKAGVSAQEAAVSGVLEASDSDKNSGSDSSSSDDHSAAGKRLVKKKVDLSKVHDKLSKVTELRKHVMPLDGTLDFWILLLAMALSLFSAGMGIKKLADSNALLKWRDGEDAVKWIGIVFAIADAIPGLLFLGYMACYDTWPRLMKVYTPIMLTISFAAITFIEVRLAFGFITGR